MDGMTMTGTLLEALDAVVWEGLATAHPVDSVDDVSRALRRLALTSTAATEEDCYPLYSLITREGRATPTATAVALPFVVALAADPALSTAVRVELIELLVALQAPEVMGFDWTQARALLADPQPAVRREALPLAEGGSDSCSNGGGRRPTRRSASRCCSPSARR
ncbi:hypothetical protein [Kitasatospora sp. NPDC057541]|uniref:hypothetical protein n=1 Tax=Kitasatospora sp. NPDC057541 TaxID=3346161 RepID=UPI0036CCFE17